VSICTSECTGVLPDLSLLKTICLFIVLTVLWVLLPEIISVNECLADGIFYVLRHNELSWYGHIFLERMVMIGYKDMSGKPRGKPKKTWKDVTESDLKHMNMSTSDALDHRSGRL